MKIRILAIGKTNEKYLEEGIQLYLKRLTHYTNLEYKELKDIRGFSDAQDLKKKEGQLFLSHLTKDDVIVLLDENGKDFHSVAFSDFIQKQRNNSTKSLVFIIGGAFGFSDEMYQASNARLKLSSMTFSHQMVRLIFLEQLYRAMTILKGEKYHNP